MYLKIGLHLMTECGSPHTCTTGKPGAGKRKKKSNGFDKDLSRTPASQKLRQRMDKWEYVKLKSFCTTK
jgi:hypothetical protein